MIQFGTNNINTLKTIHQADEKILINNSFTEKMWNFYFLLRFLKDLFCYKYFEIQRHPEVDCTQILQHSFVQLTKKPTSSRRPMGKRLKWFYFILSIFKLFEVSLGIIKGKNFFVYLAQNRADLLQKKTVKICSNWTADQKYVNPCAVNS